MAQTWRTTGRGAPASVPMRHQSTPNGAKNRAALKDMSEVELATGKPPEYWAALHAEQRDRVLRRYGLTDGAT